MARRALDGKVYFSYEDIHEAVSASVERVKAFRPDVIVAIGGGGFIPARMLRTEVKVLIAASRGLCEIMRRRRDSPPSHNEVGGFVFEFERVSGEIATRYVHTGAHCGRRFGVV